jgi:Fic family protein
MKDIFTFLKETDEIALIKSCVFHYEMEFIHPFLDGNGRIGRLWQAIILMEKYPVFEFLPFETFINKTQKEYYESLALSDKVGNSTVFIEYMLQVIDESLGELLNYKNRTLREMDRIAYFLKISSKQFTRKDFMNTFKDISTATASRDLKKATELNLITKQGNNNQTVYIINNYS